MIHQVSIVTLIYSRRWEELACDDHSSDHSLRFEKPVTRMDGPVLQMAITQSTGRSAT